MTDWIVTMLVYAGAGVMLLAALGILRMPDVFMRMQVVSKAATLGVGCLFVAVAFHFGDLGLVSRAVMVIAFTFLTAPVAAHTIGRAAYLSGQRMANKAAVDQLEGRYRARTHELSGPADRP